MPTCKASPRPCRWIIWVCVVFVWLFQTPSLHLRFQETTTFKDENLWCRADIFFFTSFFFAAEYIDFIGLTTSFNSGKFVLWVNIVPKDNVVGRKKVTSTVIRRIPLEYDHSSALTQKRPLLYVANVAPNDVYVITFSVALVDRRDGLSRNGGAVSFLIRYVVLRPSCVISRAEANFQLWLSSLRMKPTLGNALLNRFNAPYIFKIQRHLRLPGPPSWK